MLTKVCVCLEAGPGLESCCLHTVSRLTRLTCLELDMGPSPLWGHLDDHDRLVASLPNLLQLHRLRLFSLATQTGSLSVLCQIGHLQQLFVTSHNLVPQSFIALTQIEDLGFQHEGNAVVELTLPSGNQVMLQNLRLLTPCNISHLDAASQLQSISIPMP